MHSLCKLTKDYIYSISICSRPSEVLNLKIYFLGPEGVGKSYLIKKVQKILAFKCRRIPYSHNLNQTCPDHLKLLFSNIIENNCSNLRGLNHITTDITKKMFQEVISFENGVVLIDEGLISRVNPTQISTKELDSVLQVYLKNSLFIFVETSEIEQIHNLKSRSQNNRLHHRYTSTYFSRERKKYRIIKDKLLYLGGETFTFNNTRNSNNIDTLITKLKEKLRY
jgi:hypothetical protein